MKAIDKYASVDLISELKAKGYNSNIIRKNKLLAESTLQALRENKPISWANIEKLCKLLNCQPGDIIEYVDE